MTETNNDTGYVHFVRTCFRMDLLQELISLDVIIRSKNRMPAKLKNTKIGDTQARNLRQLSNKFL